MNQNKNRNRNQNKNKHKKIEEGQGRTCGAKLRPSVSNGATPETSWSMVGVRSTCKEPRSPMSHRKTRQYGHTTSGLIGSCGHSYESGDDVQPEPSRSALSAQQRALAGEKNGRVHNKKKAVWVLTRTGCRA